MFFRACSLPKEVGDNHFFTFLTSLTHHLPMVKFSEKKSMLENFRANVQTNIIKSPRVLTKTLNWPNIPKKLATASILKTCQFFTSVPNETSCCFWKPGILIRKRTQSTSRLSFHVCTAISRISRTVFGTRVMHICHLLAYFTIVSSVNGIISSYNITKYYREIQKTVNTRNILGKSKFRREKTKPQTATVIMFVVSEVSSRVVNFIVIDQYRIDLLEANQSVHAFTVV